MSADELELLERKLVKLILQLPDGRLLQPSDGLLSGRLLLTGFPQVRPFTFGLKKRSCEHSHQLLLLLFIIIYPKLGNS